jgi:hypothetical protein
VIHLRKDGCIETRNYGFVETMVEMALLNPEIVKCVGHGWKRHNTTDVTATTSTKKYHDLTTVAGKSFGMEFNHFSEVVPLYLIVFPKSFQTSTVAGWNPKHPYTRIIRALIIFDP